MDIVVNREQCVGSGVCVMRLPDVFGSDEVDGLVEVLAPDGAGHAVQDLRETAYACPSQSIDIHEA